MSYEVPKLIKDIVFTPTYRDPRTPAERIAELGNLIAGYIYTRAYTPVKCVVANIGELSGWRLHEIARWTSQQLPEISPLHQLDLEEFCSVAKWIEDTERECPQADMMRFFQRLIGTLQARGWAFASRD